MGSDATSQAGKGSAPRNCFSPGFRKEFDRIFKHKVKRCPHRIKIGDPCPDCLKASKPGYVVSLHRNKMDTTR